MTSRTRRSVVTGVLLVALVAGGCRDGGSDDDAAPAPSSAPETLPSHPTVDDLARLAGCEGPPVPFDGTVPDPPIRGGAATAGAACTLDGVETHLFVRAPAEPPPGAAVDSFLGGTVRNIDRLVGTGVEGDCQAWVAVGETWFALAEDRDVLARVADALGGGVREVLPTGPPASYEPPGCGP